MPTHSIHAVCIGTCNLLINMKYTSANEKNVNTNSDLKGGAVGSVRGTASRRRPTGTGSPTGSAAKERSFRGFEWFVLRLCLTLTVGKYFTLVVTTWHDPGEHPYLLFTLHEY